MSNKKIISLVVASLALPICASAAEVNSQGHFYGRADVGYGITNHKATVTQVATTKARGLGWLGSVGVGYYPSKEIRTELQFYLDDGFKTKKKDSDVVAKQKSMAAFANVFYDFNNSSAVTPYVMAGIGYAKNKASFSSTTSNGSLKFKSKGAFAYQAGLGVSFKVAKNFDLDLGYRLMQKSSKHSISATTEGVTTTLSLKRELDHTLLAGARVTF